MSKLKVTPEEILESVKQAVDEHEPESGYRQWYIDEFSIDCDAEEFWAVVEEALKKAFR